MASLHLVILAFGFGVGAFQLAHLELLALALFQQVTFERHSEDMKKHPIQVGNEQSLSKSSKRCRKAAKLHLKLGGDLSLLSEP